MEITTIQLRQIMPTLKQAKADAYIGSLNTALTAGEINTAKRIAAFLAQIAHESGELRYFAEIWGPTKQQLKYEPPSDLAKRLGNTKPGDGKRFKGRGPIQITGRFNYAKYSPLIGLADTLLTQPELLERPEWGFKSAAAFWKLNGLNELADDEKFVAITKKINGGVNGLAERVKYWERAKAALEVA